MVKNESEKILKKIYIKKMRVGDNHSNTPHVS